MVIKKLYPKHRSSFITKLSARLKIRRDVCFQSVFKYEGHEFCCYHNSHVFMLLRTFSVKVNTCIIPGCKESSCRYVRIPNGTNCVEWAKMEDAYECIMLTVPDRRLSLRSWFEENLDLEELRDIPIFAAHIWPLTQDWQKINRIVRPSVKHGICTCRCCSNHRHYCRSQSLFSEKT